MGTYWIAVCDAKREYASFATKALEWIDGGGGSVLAHLLIYGAWSGLSARLISDAGSMANEYEEIRTSPIWKNITLDAAKAYAHNE